MGLDEILKAADAEGKPLYSESTIRDFLALIGLATDNERLRPVVTRFKKALDEELNDGTFEARLEKYFEKHPLPARMTSELQRTLREGLAAESPMAAASNKAIGQTTTNLPSPPGRVDGTLRGGVFARVAASMANKKR